MALDMTLVYPPLVARFPFAGSELNRFVESLKAEGIQANAVNAMEQLLAKRQNEEAGILRSDGVARVARGHPHLDRGELLLLRRLLVQGLRPRAGRSTTFCSSSTCSRTTGSTSCARLTRRSRCGCSTRAGKRRVEPDRRSLRPKSRPISESLKGSHPSAVDARCSASRHRATQVPAGQRALKRAGLRSRNAAFPSARSSVCARLRNDVDSSLSASSIDSPCARCTTSLARR